LVKDVALISQLIIETHLVGEILKSTPVDDFSIDDMEIKNRVLIEMS
tara:strand:- start:4214 stop:4354 length:141 start_codon:yes stop_codon:yes gene_type:complete